MNKEMLISSGYLFVIFDTLVLYFISIFVVFCHNHYKDKKNHVFSNLFKNENNSALC